MKPAFKRESSEKAEQTMPQPIYVERQSSEEEERQKLIRKFTNIADERQKLLRKFTKPSDERQELLRKFTKPSQPKPRSHISDSTTDSLEPSIKINKPLKRPAPTSSPATPTPVKRRKTLTPHFPGSNGKIPRIALMAAQRSPLTARKIPQKPTTSLLIPKVAGGARAYTSSPNKSLSRETSSLHPTSSPSPKITPKCPTPVPPKPATPRTARPQAPSAGKTNAQGNALNRAISISSGDSTSESSEDDIDVTSTITNHNTNVTTSTIVHKSNNKNADNEEEDDNDDDDESDSDSDSDSDAAADAFNGVEQPPNTTNIDPRLVGRGRSTEESESSEEEEESQDSLIRAPLVVRRLGRGGR